MLQSHLLWREKVAALLRHLSRDADFEAVHTLTFQHDSFHNDTHIGCSFSGHHHRHIDGCEKSERHELC